MMSSYVTPGDYAPLACPRERQLLPPHRRLQHLAAHRGDGRSLVPGVPARRPPAALVVRQAERLAADVVSGPADALRLSLEFLGPVSTDPVVVVGQVVRTGRSITLVDVTLSQGGRAALHGRVWVLRRAPREARRPCPVVPPSTRTPTRSPPQDCGTSRTPGTSTGERPAARSSARGPLRSGSVPGCRSSPASPHQPAAGRARRRLRQWRLGRAGLGPVVVRQRRPRPAPSPADAG